MVFDGLLSAPFWLLWGAVESFRFATTLSLPVLIITLGYVGHITHTEDSSSAYWGTANNWPQGTLVDA